MQSDTKSDNTPSSPPPGMTAEEADRLADQFSAPWDDAAPHTPSASRGRAPAEKDTPSVIIEAALVKEAEAFTTKRRASIGPTDPPVPALPQSSSKVIWMAGIAAVIIVGVGAFIGLSRGGDETETGAAVAVVEEAPPATSQAVSEPEQAAPSQPGADPAPAAAAALAAAPSQGTTEAGAAVHSAEPTTGMREGLPGMNAQETPPSRPVEPNAMEGKVRVRIQVVPASAAVHFDGVPVRSGFETLVDQGSAHRVDASAPGYEDETYSLDFFRDQEVRIVLERPAHAAAPPQEERRARPAAREPREAREERRTETRRESPSRDTPSGSGFVVDNPY